MNPSSCTAAGRVFFLMLFGCFFYNSCKFMRVLSLSLLVSGWCGKFVAEFSSFLGLGLGFATEF